MILSLARRPEEGSGLSIFRNDVNVLSIFIIHLSVSIGLTKDRPGRWAESHRPASVCAGDCRVGSLEADPETRFVVEGVC